MDARILPANEFAPWVSISTPPMRMGIFQVRAVGSLDEPWYSFWDGGWHGAWTSPDEAFDHMDFPTAGSVSHKWEWRGLVRHSLDVFTQYCL